MPDRTRPVSALLPSSGLPTAAGPRASSKAFESQPGAAHVDAINQLFTELELAYHNQFHRAFASQQQVGMAKQLWLHALADLDPARIVAGGRRAIGDSEYLPNLAALRRYCDPSPEELGMPDPRSAYIEACRAPSPKSAAAWSHPVVYHAGRASDWHLLSTAPEQIAFPVFKRNYELLVQRVRDGGDLQSPVPPALTERVDRELPLEERRRRLARLRSDLGL